MDVTEIAKLYTSPVPYVSLYLDTPVAVENAAQRLETAWKSARGRLAEDGVDEVTLDALDGAVRDDRTEGNALVVFASHGSVLYRRRLPESLTTEVARCDSLPYVVPLLAWRQSRVPHVVVLADRSGADILAYVDDAEPVVTEDVRGSHDVIHKAGPGGWSQMRYQHRAEDSWEGNAREVADEVDRVVARLRPEVVLVRGDVRAVQYLQEHLAEATKPLVRVVERGSGRAADGGDEVTAEEIAEHLADVADSGLRRVLDEFQEERGQGDRATDGVRATVEALRKAQVATLLLRDEPDDDRRLWFADDPSLVALSRDDLTGLGAEHVQDGRLADVLVRAAVGTGADVAIVQSGPNEGVGAILRYAR